jgi:dihydrofolate reductase
VNATIDATRLCCARQTSQNVGPGATRERRTWRRAASLSGDLVATIGELKAEPAGELHVQGSGTLTRWLLENDLVDEMNLLVVPVVVGQGARLFPDTGPDMALELVESRASPKGITIHVYRPNGRPEYATD